MTPIATKPLGLDEVEQLQKRLEVWRVDINARKEIVTVEYDIVLLSPANNVVKVLDNTCYTRYNSKEGDFYSRLMKQVTKNNLKFDELRASQIGQMIAGLIALDIANYNGPESLEQIIYTEPQAEV